MATRDAATDDTHEERGRAPGAASSWSRDARRPGGAARLRHAALALALALGALGSVGCGADLAAAAAAGPGDAGGGDGALPPWNEAAGAEALSFDVEGADAPPRAAEEPDAEGLAGGLEAADLLDELEADALAPFQPAGAEDPVEDPDTDPFAEPGAVRRPVSPVRLPAAPPRRDLTSCLAMRGVGGPRGVVLNRFFWCQQMIAVFPITKVSGWIPTSEGVVTMRFVLVGIGSKNTRTLRMYMRGWGAPTYRVTAEALPLLRNAISMEVAFDCRTTRAAECSAYGPVAQTLERWSTGEWVYWDVTSNEALSTLPDRVTFHDVQMKGRTGVPPPYVSTSPTLRWRGVPHRIRCDSADYFQNRWWSYPAACVFDEVIPHLIYRRSDTRVDDVANHIYDAFVSPDATWPVELDAAGRERHKRIPGRYTGRRSDPGLRRIRTTSRTYADNRTYKDWACSRTGPYASTGLPSIGADEDCDEFPFRVTLEGASSPSWDFSVRGVDASKNRSAGAALGNYLRNDRILYETDGFWVQILN